MTADQNLDADAQTLADMGYKQELHRGMSGFSNFAVSFSIISILAGCITSYKIALVSGGPSTIVLGWLIVGIMVLTVALSMAEVCSRYPTAGGLYFWAGRLAKKNKRQWAWYVGWFNFLGEIAVTAAIDFGCATTWMAFANLVWGVEVTPQTVFLVFVVIILSHAALNTFGVNLVSLLSSISAWWHVVGVLIIVGALWILPTKHQSVAWTLTGFHNETGWSFLPYVFLDGPADGPVHLHRVRRLRPRRGGDEERVRRGPPGHRAECAGLGDRRVRPALLDHRLHPGQLRGGADGPGRQRDRIAAGADLPGSLGNPDVAKFLLFIVCVAQYFCGMASVTANSRMSFAFSRDHALPGSRIWAKVNPRTGTPTNSIWFCVTLSIVLALPALISATAYLAVTSIAVIGLYIAYVVPVFLRRLSPDFVPGPWNLGRWSPLIGWLAVGWVVLICILFVLPPAYPITISTFNYAPVAVLVVLIIATVSWQVGGKRTFMEGRDVEHTTKSLGAVLDE